MTPIYSDRWWLVLHAHTLNVMYCCELKWSLCLSCNLWIIYLTSTLLPMIQFSIYKAFVLRQSQLNESFQWCSLTQKVLIRDYLKLQNYVDHFIIVGGRVDLVFVDQMALGLLESKRSATSGAEFFCRQHLADTEHHRALWMPGYKMVPVSWTHWYISCFPVHLNYCVFILQRI